MTMTARHAHAYRFLQRESTARGLITAGLGIWLFTLASTRAFAATWAQDALQREAGFIVNCSFTEQAVNNVEVQATDDAYGCINVDRIYQAGPDWVRPGESAMGAIGLMAAAQQLQRDGLGIATYDSVLGKFFGTWVLARKQPVNTNAASADFGGFYQRVYYSGGGQWQSNASVTAAVTGQMIGAMWKYYEYLRATGQSAAASNWLQRAWPIVQPAGDFIRRMTNATYRLVRGNASGNDLWISDSVFGVVTLRVLDRWASVANQPRSFDYGALADVITQGIAQMKDSSSTTNFFKYRQASAGYALTYGDSIDQLCFLPYEAEVLDPVEPFCRRLSDWWTSGSGVIRMTASTVPTNDWRYFGTHWHYYFLPRIDNEYLFTGPGLQLAKVEWKNAQRTGDSVTLQRAGLRLQWAASTNYSSLWFGATGASEGGVSNGLMDWRNGTNYSATSPTWQRFVDSSAYFIEAVLMLNYGVNVKYIPNTEPSIARVGTNLVVRWPGTGTLQSSTNVTGPWFSLTNVVSPVTNSAPAAAAFFRLEQ